MQNEHEINLHLLQSKKKNISRKHKLYCVFETEVLCTTLLILHDLDDLAKNQ